MSETGRWSVRDILVALFIVLFIAVQVTLPLAMLIRRGGFVLAPAKPNSGELPFSWQMYTVVIADPAVIVTRDDGTVERVSLVPLLGELGARTAYDPAALRGLCSRFPAARQLTYAVGAAHQDVEC